MKNHLVAMDVYIQVRKGANKMGTRILLRALRQGRYTGEIFVYKGQKLLDVKEVYFTMPEMIMLSRVMPDLIQVSPAVKDGVVGRDETYRKMDERSAMIGNAIGFNREPEGPTLELFDKKVGDRS